MKLDDPAKPEFASWQSYQEFARRVRHNRRYVWGREIQAFLDTVLATISKRDVRIKKGTILFRSQHGIDFHDFVDDDGNSSGPQPVGYNAKRMKPLVDRAKEGRVNPAGIPVLYLATTVETAISEVRPWVGSEVSVANFEVTRDLRAINLSLGHGKFSLEKLTLSDLEEEAEPDAKTKQEAVWIDLDSAFSQPITRSDDTADYVPTQILAELFRSAGYDAVVYRSQFGKKGYNVGLFNLNDAEAMSCAPYHVTRVAVSFTQIGNDWFASKKSEK